MTELKRNRIKAVLKYTWPFYIVAAIVAYLVLSFIFNATHQTPAYKTLTIFVSGEVTDQKKLRSDILDKYQDNQLKSFSCISARITDGNYTTKLTVAGYASADVLILPVSKLDNLSLKTIAIDLQEQLINDYYQGYTFYQQESINYGVKIDKGKVNQYMTLPDEDCYMLLNGASKNLGDYSTKPVTEHDNALRLARDWGM